MGNGLQTHPSKVVKLGPGCEGGDKDVAEG